MTIMRLTVHCACTHTRRPRSPVLVPSMPAPRGRGKEGGAGKRVLRAVVGYSLREMITCVLLRLF